MGYFLTTLNNLAHGSCRIEIILVLVFHGYLNIFRQVELVRFWKWLMHWHSSVGHQTEWVNRVRWVLVAVSNVSQTQCFIHATYEVYGNLLAERGGGDGAIENAKRTIQISALVRALCMAGCLTNSFCKLLRAKPDVIQPCIWYLLLSISLLNIHIII